mmetsp:Transcript_37655/g.106399  ORF Transcript_37655/g.106399 Transcript_37655/m.106399 type:complete len:318 (+) Transcript_37655:485-1438(+)
MAPAGGPQDVCPATPPAAAQLWGAGPVRPGGHALPHQRDRRGSSVPPPHPGLSDRLRQPLPGSKDSGSQHDCMGVRAPPAGSRGETAAAPLPLCEWAVHGALRAWDSGCGQGNGLGFRRLCLPGIEEGVPSCRCQHGGTHGSVRCRQHFAPGSSEAWHRGDHGQQGWSRHISEPLWQDHQKSCYVVERAAVPPCHVRALRACCGACQTTRRGAVADPHLAARARPDPASAGRHKGLCGHRRRQCSCRICHQGGGPQVLPGAHKRADSGPSVTEGLPGGSEPLPLFAIQERAPAGRAPPGGGLPPPPVWGAPLPAEGI